MYEDEAPYDFEDHEPLGDPSDPRFDELEPVEPESNVALAVFLMVQAVLVGAALALAFTGSTDPALVLAITSLGLGLIRRMVTGR